MNTIPKSSWSLVVLFSVTAGAVFLAGCCCCGPQAGGGSGGGDRTGHNKLGNLPRHLRKTAKTYAIERDVLAAGESSTLVAATDGGEAVVVFGDMLDYEVDDQAPLNFQWYKDDQPISLPEAKKATLILTSVKGTDAGYYSCAVSEPGSRQTNFSNPIRLEVMPKVAMAAQGSVGTLAVLAAATAPVTVLAQPVNAGSCIGAASSFIRYSTDKGAVVFQATTASWKVSATTTLPGSSPSPAVVPTTTYKIVVKNAFTQKTVYCNTADNAANGTGGVLTPKSYYYIASYYTTNLPNGTISTVTASPY